MNRRQMIAASAATIAANVLGRRKLAADDKPAARFIDMHTHLGTYTNGNKELTAKALVEWMDEHGIEKAVVLPLVSPESHHVSAASRRRHPSIQGVSGPGSFLSVRSTRERSFAAVGRAWFQSSASMWSRGLVGLASTR